jgi:hypothetical protein
LQFFFKQHKLNQTNLVAESRVQADQLTTKITLVHNKLMVPIIFCKELVEIFQSMGNSLSFYG